MKIMLASIALATVSALGLARAAEAASMSPVATSAALRGGFGIGFSTGGGYAQPSGYYTTEYRWVPTSVLAGYDAYNRPVYSTEYVQQAFQVWVPTATYYAPSYGTSGYGYGYSRPSVSFGFGSGHYSGHSGSHSSRGYRSGGSSGGHRGGGGRGHHGR